MTAPNSDAAITIVVPTPTAPTRVADESAPAASRPSCRARRRRRSTAADISSCARSVDEEDREHHRAEEVRRCRPGRVGRRYGWPSDVAQPLARARSACCCRLPRPRAGHAASRFRIRHEQPDSDEAERVDEDRVRRREHLDQPAADRRARRPVRRSGDLELRVALDQLLALTSEGRYDWYATSKNTVRMPTRKPTT